MSAELVCVAGSKSYSHDIMPQVVIAVSSTYKDSDYSLLYRDTVWTITGLLIGTPSSDVKTQVDELKDFYLNNVLSSAKIKDGSVTLDELSNSGIIQMVDLSFPQGGGPEWATKRTYTLTLKGLTVSSAVQTSGEYTYTIQYAMAQNTRVTRTVSGTVKDLYGKAAYAKYSALVVANGWGTWAGANQVNSTYSVNETGTECSFNLAHEQYFDAFPSGVTNGSVSQETSKDSAGQILTKISGSFEGSESSCTSAINALRPGTSFLVSESISRQKYSNTTTFDMVYMSTALNDIISNQWQLSIQSQITGTVYRRVLGGGNPVSQATAKTTAKASYTGTIKKVSAYATAPAHAFGTEYVINAVVTKGSPEAVLDGQKIFPLEFNYQYEFPTTPVWPL